MKVVGGWPGRRVVGLNGRFGVLPANIANLGAFPSPLLACVDPGDDNTEFVWVVEGSLPSSGTVTANDDGSFSQVGAADGTYITTARLYTWAPGGPVVDRGTFTTTTQFGVSTSATAPGVTLTAATQMLSGSASGVRSAAAAGVVLSAAAFLVAGAASGPSRVISSFYRYDVPGPGSLRYVVPRLSANIDL